MCLFNCGNVDDGQCSVLTFAEEYECLENLGPITRKTLTEFCYGKWSSYDILKMMWQRNLNPKLPAHDQRVADLILRKDRFLLGGI